MPYPLSLEQVKITHPFSKKKNNNNKIKEKKPFQKINGHSCIRFPNQGHSTLPHSGEYKSHQRWSKKFKLFTTTLHQVNSKLVSSKFQQDQEQSKDKELTVEINTNSLRNTFSYPCRKIKMQVKHHLGFTFACGKISQTHPQKSHLECLLPGLHKTEIIVTGSEVQDFLSSLIGQKPVDPL